MRNIHDLIRTELGRESVAIFRRWEQIEKKIANTVIIEGLPLDV